MKFTVVVVAGNVTDAGHVMPLFSNSRRTGLIMRGGISFLWF